MPHNRPKTLEEINANDWNRTAYVVGGGPSLIDFNWSLLGPDKFVVAINQSHTVLPYAQIVYFTDMHYWRESKQSLIKHKGILVRGTLNPKGEEKNTRITYIHLTGPEGLDYEYGKVKHGTNSTYAVVNMLSIHFKFNKIYIMGIDMKWGADHKSHWHNGYNRKTPQSTYNIMMNNFNKMAPELAKINVKVINVINPKEPSDLKCFPTQNLTDVFGENAFIKR
jgi:hypothetical protein